MQSGDHARDEDGEHDQPADGDLDLAQVHAYFQVLPPALDVAALLASTAALMRQCPPHQLMARVKVALPQDSPLALITQRPSTFGLCGLIRYVFGGLVLGSPSSAWSHAVSSAVAQQRVNQQVRTFIHVRRRTQLRLIRHGSWERIAAREWDLSTRVRDHAAALALAHAAAWQYDNDEEENDCSADGDSSQRAYSIRSVARRCCRWCRRMYVRVHYSPSELSTAGFLVDDADQHVSRVRRCMRSKWAPRVATLVLLLFLVVVSARVCRDSSPQCRDSARALAQTAHQWQTTVSQRAYAAMQREVQFGGGLGYTHAIGSLGALGRASLLWVRASAGAAFTAVAAAVGDLRAAWG
jgi:hypothetical protein